MPKNKSSILGAIFGSKKGDRLRKETAKKKNLFAEWLKHRKEAGKQAMGLAQWVKAGNLKKGKRIAYYGQKRETADATLRRIKRGK